MEMNKIINWWELEPSIHLQLSRHFLILLRKTRKGVSIKLNVIAKEMNIHEYSVLSWERGSRCISVGHLTKLLEILNLAKSELYGNIDAIYTSSKKFAILCPNLPFNIKEEYTQILAHGVFDGTEDHSKSGKIGIIYQSSKESEQEMFKDLVLICDFGRFNMNKSLQGHYRFPSTLTQILMYHYNFNSLNSRKAEFPKMIMEEVNHNERLRKLILKAAFIDEGSCGLNKIRDNLCVVSSINHVLIQQISNILELMGYSYFINKPKNGCESIYLHSSSLPKFYKDVIVLLPKGYYKRINTEILLKRQDREKNIQIQVEILKKIANEQGSIKITQIQKLLKLHEASARRRIIRLMKYGKIVKKSRGVYEAIQNT